MNSDPADSEWWNFDYRDGPHEDFEYLLLHGGAQQVAAGALVRGAAGIVATYRSITHTAVIECSQGAG